MAKKYETVKDILTKIEMSEEQLKQVSKVCDASDPIQKGVNDSLVQSVYMDGYKIMKEFIKKLHPGTRVL